MLTQQSYTAHAEAHAHGALVSHPRRATPRPRGLHIPHARAHLLVARIDEQRDADVDDLGDERVALLVRRVRLDLREDERVPAFYDASREAGYYAWGTQTSSARSVGCNACA